MKSVSDDSHPLDDVQQKFSRFHRFILLRKPWIAVKLELVKGDVLVHTLVKVLDPWLPGVGDGRLYRVDDLLVVIHEDQPV